MKKGQNRSLVLLAIVIALFELAANYVDVTFRYLVANINGNINVQAPPYFADCKNGTDNQAIFAQALSDSTSFKEPIYISTNGCTGNYKTSKLVYSGQPIYGDGANELFAAIQSEPGQDIFQVPEPTTSSWVGFQQNSYWKDLRLVVDSSSDSSGSTFPNRHIELPDFLGSISSSASTTTLTVPRAQVGYSVGDTIVIAGAGAAGANLVTTITAMSVPGETTWTVANAASTTVTGAIVSTPATVSLSTPTTVTVGSVVGFFPGQVVTIYGAGVAAANLTTTVTAVTGYSDTLTIATSASTAVTNANITGQLQVGNCALAVQDADGNKSDWVSNAIATPDHFTVQRVRIDTTGGNEANHACAMTFQAEPYDSTFQDLTINQLYYGLLELPPATNQTSREYAPDYNTYIRDAITAHFGMLLLNTKANKLITTQLYNINVGDVGLWMDAFNAEIRYYNEDLNADDLDAADSGGSGPINDWFNGVRINLKNAFFNGGTAPYTQWEVQNGSCQFCNFSNTGSNPAIYFGGLSQNNLFSFTTVSNATDIASDTSVAIGSNSIQAGNYTSSNIGSSFLTIFGNTPTVGGVTAQGTIGSGGTLSCPLSATVTICTATVGGGAYTIAKPTGAVANVDYEIILTSTNNSAGTFASGWFAPSTYAGGGLGLPKSVNSWGSGAIVTIRFKTNGTNYYVDAVGPWPAKDIYAATINTEGIASTGGTPPTCSASTGTCLTLANANCTGNSTPWSCCTGSGTGTCSGSNNNRGQIYLTGGTADTSITLTFSAAFTWPQFPYCVFTDANASITPAAYSAGSITNVQAIIDFAAVNSASINYLCE